MNLSPRIERTREIRRDREAGRALVRRRAAPKELAVAGCMITLSPEQRTLLAKLATLAQMIKQHRTTLSMLDREQLQLRTQLRLTGWRRPEGPE